MIYRFADSVLLLLLALIPLAVWWYVRQSGRHGAIRYSRVDTITRCDRRRTARWRHLLFVARIVALSALIVGFARPQSGVTEETVTTQGIDIVMALDLSTSMLAEDLTPTRIEAAKQVAAEFIQGRRNDRIGLVVFAGEAFTQAPLTLDYDVVTAILADLEPGIIEDGTAIGMGLATAVKRLQDSNADSRVIVLLTDGRNNRGEIDPVTAAHMAQALGIKIYTIGAGTRGVTRVTIDDPVLGQRVVPMRVDIDEDVLREVAARTRGQYYRATDRESLEAIYQEIDALETTEMEVDHFTRYGELFHLPLAVGLGLIVLEMTMANTVLRRIP